MRRALLSFSILACAACSAIAGLNEDYVVDDTTSAATDAGEMDAPVTPVVDGGTSVDATADAAPAPFCPDGGAIFCTDFEHTTTLASEWTRTENTGGMPTLANGIGVDRSRALDATMTAASDATAATVAWRTVATSFPVGTTFTLTFSFNVKAKATNYAALGVIQVNGIEQGLAMYDASKCLVGVACLDENDQTGRGHANADSFGLTLLEWHKAVVSVTRNAAGYAGSITVDGHSVYSSTTTGALPANAASANPVTVEVGVGSFYSSGKGVNDVVIDDVLVTNQLP